MTTLRQATRVCFILLFPLLPGCIQAPKATVELAEIVDRQVAELQGSHERLVRQYYGMLRERAETFLNERWTPVFLGKALENEEFKKEFDKALATARIDFEQLEVRLREGELTEQDRLALEGAVKDTLALMKGRLGSVMTDFAEAARVQIQAKRRELLEPIDEQEGLVLDALRGTYADLQQGTASLKAYLASAVELKASQDAVLQKLGLLDAQRKVVDTAVRASELAENAIERGEDIDGVIEKLKSLTAEARVIGSGTQ